MKCLLCNLTVTNDKELLNHYISIHWTKEDNYYFKELFLVDANSAYTKNVRNVKKSFITCREKNHSFIKT